jgi:hypothetical protein
METDYSKIFNTGDTFAVNPNMNYTPQPAQANSMNLGTILGNPAIQRIAFEMAAAMDPEGFGGRLAKAGIQMQVANQQAAGLTKAQQAFKGQPQPQAPNPQQQIPNPAQGGDIADIAKQYTNLGSMLKNANGIDPKNVPSGYVDTFVKSLSLEPQAGNPTQPVGNLLAGAPTGESSQVYSAPPALEIDPASAMAMGPEGVQQVFGHYATMDALDLARREQAYKQDPARYKEELFKAVAPGVAQAYAMAEAEVSKIKAVGAFTSQRAEEFITNNPLVAKKVLPNGMTVAQFVRLNASNPAAAENITNMLNVQKDYEAAIYSANLHYKAAKENADAQGRSDEFFKLTNAFQEYNKQANSKLLSIEEYNAMPPAERIMSGAIPRTKEAEETIRIAKQMRDLIGVQLYGPAYGEMIKSVQKLDAITGGGQNEVADPTKLKQLMEEDKRKSRGASRSFSNNPIYDLFNPTGGPS